MKTALLAVLLSFIFAAPDEGNMTNALLSCIAVLSQQLDFVIPRAPCYPAVGAG
jgi:hypothetical protein